MTFLVDSTIKASLIIFTALISTALMRRQSASLRHWILAVAVLLALTAPALALFTPSWHLSVLRAIEDDVSVSVSQSAFVYGAVTNPAVIPQPATGNVDLAQKVLLLVWSLGLLVSGIVLIIGVVRLGRIAAAARSVDTSSWSRLAAAISREYRIKRSIRLLHSRNQSILATWGVFKPKIVLPAAALEWNAERLQVVFSHELAHVRRSDWIIQLAAELLRAIYWFNPLFWMACRRLRLESEYACDDLALGRGIAGTDYAAHLLELARDFTTSRCAWSAALTMARPSTIERRFEAMLNPLQNRRPVTAAGMIVAAFALALAAAPIVTFSSTPASVAAPPAAPAVTAVTALPAVKIPEPIAPPVSPALGPRRAPQAVSLYTIQGEVTDASGAVMPGVEVSAVPAGTAGNGPAALTNERGEYSFASLPSGTYRVIFRKPGFKILNIDNVTVYPQPSTVNAVLDIGAVHEEVTVRALASSANAGSSASVSPDPPACSFVPPLSPLPAPASGRTRIRVGGNVQFAMLVNQTRPVYPAEAKAAQIQGSVVMQNVIGTDGRIINNQVLSGNPVLVAAAIEAIERWCYRPTLLNGVPVETVADITVNFVLEN